MKTLIKKLFGTQPEAIPDEPPISKEETLRRIRERNVLRWLDASNKEAYYRSINKPL